MSTATKTFERKGVYHSDLCRASGTDGLLVIFTGKPRESTYPNKPPFVGFRVVGDDTPYTLNIENDSVRASLEGVPLDTQVIVKARGKGPEAYVLLEDANANPIIPEDTPPKIEWREATGPYPAELDAKPSEEKKPTLRETLAERYYIALCAADDAMQRFAKEHAGSQPSDAVRNIATTIFIQSSGR